MTWATSRPNGKKLDTGEIVYWFDVTHEKVN